MHGLAFLAAWLNPLPIGVRILLAGAVAASFGSALKRERREFGFSGLRLRPDGSWELHARDGAVLEATLLGSTLANPWFVLLRFKTESLRPSLLICRDSLAEDEYRRLRVALKVVGSVEAKELARR